MVSWIEGVGEPEMTKLLSGKEMGAEVEGERVVEKPRAQGWRLLTAASNDDLETTEGKAKTR